MLEEMVDEAAVTDPLAPYSTDECLVREARYWKVLNLATVASLGACAHTPVPSSCPSVQEGFQECDATLAALRGMRRAKGNTLAMKGVSVFVYVCVHTTQTHETKHTNTQQQNTQTHNNKTHKHTNAQNKTPSAPASGARGRGCMRVCVYACVCVYVCMWPLAGSFANLAHTLKHALYSALI